MDGDGRRSTRLQTCTSMPGMAADAALCYIGVLIKPAAAPGFPRTTGTVRCFQSSAGCGWSLWLQGGRRQGGQHTRAHAPDLSRLPLLTTHAIHRLGQLQSIPIALAAGTNSLARPSDGVHVSSFLHETNWILEMRIRYDSLYLRDSPRTSRYCIQNSTQKYITVITTTENVYRGG